MTTQEFKDHILPLKHKLYRFALAYLREEADARDIVQEVMLAAWEKIRSLDSVKNPEAWCMTLTRNKSLNMLKKKGRSWLPIAEQYDLASGEAGPHKHTVDKEAAGNIREVIASLPEKQRAVITLRDVEGYSYQEIAVMLQLDMNNVKVLLFRARKKVKEFLTRINQYGISQA